VNKTASYTALDDQTVEWVGVPGYLTLNPSAFFWTPLPKHAFSQYAVKDLSTTEAVTRKPLGWGPYMIDSWQAGDHIRLVKNPNYFRASEGLPKFDVVVYRFLGNVPKADLSPVLTGECDIIDTSVTMSDQILAVRTLEKSGKLKGYYGQGPEWDAINFGITPSSYDDVFNPFVDRTDFFGDVRTRQAIADCIDRPSIISNFALSLSELPSTYLTSKHPYFVANLPTYAYDPAKGEQLLDAVGWKDTDNDPSTPRVSAGVNNVLDGKPFEITYLATDAGSNSDLTQAIAGNLQQCGIKLDVKLVSAADMYAAGPDGLVFGRNFDLAQMGWTTGRQNPCFLFASSEIPNAKNSWLGTKYGGVNMTGYSNPAYDTACEAYLTAGLGAGAANMANQQALTQLANDVPFIPLYFKTKVMVSRPDLCGLTLDVSARSGLKDIESLDIGTCKQ
jgi:peptide/nickel transport system substrate-binding protein